MNVAVVDYRAFDFLRDRIKTIAGVDLAKN